MIWHIGYMLNVKKKKKKDVKYDSNYFHLFLLLFKNAAIRTCKITEVIHMMLYCTVLVYSHRRGSCLDPHGRGRDLGLRSAGQHLAHSWLQPLAPYVRDTLSLSLFRHARLVSARTDKLLFILQSPISIALLLQEAFPTPQTKTWSPLGSSSPRSLPLESLTELVSLPALTLSRLLTALRVKAWPSATTPLPILQPSFFYVRQKNSGHSELIVPWTDRVCQQ